MLEFPADFGRYRLTGIAGEGGMATVYRAILPGPMGFEKKLVVKVIRPALVEDEEFLRALVTEALLGCQLHHPNIIEVYEFNQVKGRYYLAMELVDGISLSYLVKRHRKVEAEVPKPVVLYLMQQMLEGLEYAHGARSDDDGELLGVIHRDLKPSNIAISRGGMVKILDFGIARASVDRGGMETSGAVRGTPRYMSPEQIETPLQLTPASDLFSLGTVLYELVCSYPLFAPKAGQEPLELVLHMPLEEHIEELGARFPGMGPVFGKMIARSVAYRFQTAKEVLEALRPLQDRDGDLEAAKIYLAQLVREYKAELVLEPDVPEYFQPGYATGWAPSGTALAHGDISGPSAPSLYSAQTRAAPPEPARHDIIDPATLPATIPLPAKPDQLISGKHIRIGPQTGETPSTNIGTSAGFIPVTHGTGHVSTGTLSRRVSMDTSQSVTVQQGANWSLVAALAVPLVLILIVGVVVGLGALLGEWPGSRVADRGGLPDMGGGGMSVKDVTTEPRTRGTTGGGTVQPIHDHGTSGGTETTTPQVETPTEPSDRPEPPAAEEVVTPEPRTPEPRTPEPRTPRPVQTGGASGYGRALIDAEPWASVTIDGKSYGETPVNAKLKVGDHTVKLRCMGEGPPISTELTVSKDEDTRFYKQFATDLCP